MNMNLTLNRFASAVTGNGIINGLKTDAPSSTHTFSHIGFERIIYVSESDLKQHQIFTQVLKVCVEAYNNSLLHLFLKKNDPEPYKAF